MFSTHILADVNNPLEHGQQQKPHSFKKKRNSSSPEVLDNDFSTSAGELVSHPGIVTGLILYRSYEGNSHYCESRGVHPEDTVMLQSSLTSGFISFSIPSSTMVPGLVGSGCATESPSVAEHSLNTYAGYPTHL